jgi:hypothetical protein
MYVRDAAIRLPASSETTDAFAGRSRYAANPRRRIGEINKSAEIWNRSRSLRTITLARQHQKRLVR